MTVKQIILVLIALGIAIPFFIPARTEEIISENGKESIAEIVDMEIGGTEQSLIIRGKDLNNPILLFLSGGPGASELARVRDFNQDLENDYTLVVWEQRGGEKSFDGSLKKEDLEVEDFVNDIKEVSEYLIDRFNKEKIYLMGHSWGTIIGVEAAKKFPELFHAYIGAAQMVSVKNLIR
jgi:pimeloyl-ACP methyl ester carboxylesterase